MKNIALATVGILATSIAIAAGPGGGTSPGGGGNQPGGNQPGGGGSSVTFTFDTFLEAATTNSNGTITRAGVWTGYTSSIASPAVASSVASLASGVCSGCTTLTSVDLSSCTSLTEIPDSAFSGCTSLTSVTLPTSCTTIGPNAFAGCIALSSFTGAGVATIGADAFRGCTALKALPSAATTLGAYAYAGSGLASVDASGLSLGEGAFAGCTSLASLSGASDLPVALCAGCTALDVSDWTAVTSFGQASLAGIPAATLTLDASATLGAYALAADEATLATTLSGSAVPAHDATSFLGREASYTVADGILARIEAEALVSWLGEQAADAASTVAQPASYATADLETWLATQSNADAILLFAYAEAYAADANFHPLDVAGTSFLWSAPDEVSVSSVSISLEGSYAIGDTAAWSEENLAYDEATGAYVAADADAEACFARLRLEKGW